MKSKIICILLALVFLVGITASPAVANSFSWGINYPESITVGESSTVTIDVSTSEAIDLHVCFKGEFWWDHWTYEEKVETLNAGDHSLEFTFTIPYDLHVEALVVSEVEGPWEEPYRYLPENYYFYVFSTTPGGDWGSGSDNKGSLYLPGAGAVNTDTVIYLDVDDQLLLTTGVRMIKDKILPPPGQPDDWADQGFDEGLRQSLIAKLDKASNIIKKAYDSGKLNRLNSAKGMLLAFINEMESDNPASTYSKAGECVDLTTFIVEWIEEAK